MKSNSIKVSSIVCGLLFLAAGALLFAFNAGGLNENYKSVIFSWQMLLIAIGFVSFFSRNNWGFGVVLMLIGIFFLLPKLNIVGLDFIANNRWAIVLMVIGIIVICRTIWKQKFHWWHTKYIEWESSEKEEHKQKHNNSHQCKSNDKHSGHIDYNCVFTGGVKKMDFKNFSGGEINNVFSGVEIDMSEAQMAEGAHHLELNTVFGGVTIYAPVEWNIEIRQSSHVFGSFVDNRPKPGFEVDEKSKLIIEANAVFGGVEIKCK